MGAGVGLVGSPDTVAAQMAETMQDLGGDGFLIVLPDVRRKSVAEITEGLVPAPQQRGLTWRKFEHTLLRDNLLALSVPPRRGHDRRCA